MDTPPPRSRAPQMDRDARREMIVARTIDLLVEHGRPATTREIAAAAGIGEGTIFRVFADKDELLRECLLEAMRMREATARIAQTDPTGALEERLVQALSVMQDHIARVGTVAAVLGTHVPKGPSADRDAAFSAARDALARLMESERGRLSRPPEQISALLIGLLFERSFGPAAAMDLSVPDLVSIVLHGTLTPEPGEDT
ncbi:TetR/AcrR family transcriptional regulator [Nocardiopsis sp. NPDC057823]|uniref:TetR/AcrR family transcriptional regulator n=1 Tax=Nocardiopsis sp. NPDC057823 TaxID=3346256 RepID=UPI00366C69CF